MTYRESQQEMQDHLCATARCVLTLEMGPRALPAGVYGPLPSGTEGLILEQSSLMKGF